MRLLPIRRVVIVGIGAFVPALATAQATGRIVGTVTDTGGVPIENAQVLLPKLRRGTRTSATGRYVLDSLPAGSYAVRVIHFGFAPSAHMVIVDAQSSVSQSFALVPMVQLLPPQITTASRRGIHGVVADTGWRPIVGAYVRVLGAGLAATTDSTGRFDFDVKPGRHALMAEADGFASRTIGVAPDDSGRNVVVLLRPATRALTGARYQLALFELRTRMARVGGSDHMLTTEELEHYDGRWLVDALAALRGINVDPSCPIALDGGVQTTVIGQLASDEVELVEVYDASTQRQLGVFNQSVRPSPSLGAGTRAGSGTQRSAPTPPGVTSSSNGCPMLVAWLRH